jgi:HEAT repeat protein
MLQSLSEKSDRLRAVGYGWFEHNADPQLVPRMLEALNHEDSEFVRPALTRTLAAYASDSRVRAALGGLVVKGQDFFRSAVIEAIGDYKGAYALPALIEVAKLDGPLQDDAVLAIGKIGDKKSLETLAALQRTAPRAVQPSIAAAICLLGVNCSSHQCYLEHALNFSMENDGFRELLRASSAGLAALAIAGNAGAATVLVDKGVPSRDPARAAIALALGAVALRNTPLLLQVLQTQTDPKPAILLLGESFDMLEEDLDEERFYAMVRRGYWAAPVNAPARKIAETLIQTLDF